MEALMPFLPTHIEDTIRSVAWLHAEHHQATTRLRRFVDRLTALVGQPRFIGAATCVAMLWLGGNLLALRLGGTVVDPPPFAWFDGGVSLPALYIALLILTTQRRADELHGTGSS